MSSNKRAFLNPDLDSSDDEIDQKSKKQKVDDDFEDYDESEEETFEEDDMTTETSEDNISDPDYVPEDAYDVTDDEVVVDETSNDKSKDKNDSKEGSPKKTTNNEESESKATTFTNKLNELKAKGISLQKAGDISPSLSISKAGLTESNNRVDVNVANNNAPADPKVIAFVKSIINFPHDRKCLERCQLVSEENLEMLSSLSDSSVCSPDFIKSCVSLVSCSIRLGDITMARKSLTNVFKLSEIQGISPLSQALIGGVRSQSGNIDEIESWEKKGLEAFKNKQFIQAANHIAKALKIATSCIRLKLAQGDAFCFLNKFTEGDKVANSVLEQDKTNVAAMFLKGYCLYQKKELDKAINVFQQTIIQSADHTRAKTFVAKIKLLKEKKDNACKAANKNKLDEAVNLFSQAIDIDPINQSMRSYLLAERGNVYLKQKKPGLALQDCEASLQADSSSFDAQILKAKCLNETQQFGEALSILETMNTTDRHAQQKKKSEAETAARSKKLDEATKLYYEVVEIDRRNGRYRQLLRDTKQKHNIASRLDYYALLSVEKTAGEGELRKAYFKKSREFHPDKHANASDEVKEEFSQKFKQAKEAYEVLSNIEKRKNYDKGTINPPPGGWYRDVDKRFLTTLKRMSESQTIVMPNISKMANIDIKSAGSTRGRAPPPTRGRGRPSVTVPRGGAAPTMKTGPGITINRVPPTRGSTRSRGRK